MTPDTNLADGQIVHVVGKGFTPNEANLGINECADKGDQTGMGDCNITALKSATADATGTVTADFAVVKGPFGQNAVVCSATQKCLISVSQLSPSPAEEADAEISFK